MGHSGNMAALAAAVVLAASAAWGAGSKAMSVQVKNGQLRDKPSYLGAIVGALAYGDRVQVLEESGAWIKVGRGEGGVQGWMHGSALTTKKVKLEAGEKDAQVAASSDELALAGKGFNQQVEAEFKAKNKNVDFTWIDKMGKIVIPVEEVMAFLKEGGVEMAEGGTK